MDSSAKHKGGPWKPGQSGNPAGRPRDLLKAQLDAADPDGSKLCALVGELLAEARAKGDTELAFKIAHFYAERRWGRAAQPLQHEGDAGPRMVVVMPGGKPPRGEKAGG